MSTPHDAHTGARAEAPLASTPRARRREEGKIGYAILWLLGVPIPVLIGIYLLRGCA